MKQYILTIGIAILSFVQGFSQAYFNQADSTAVGIFEHLGDTIPMNLKFVNEKNDTVVLGNLITKPTVFTFVYFDCPGICSPLLDGVSDVIEKSEMELGKEYQVITISFNYRDNPEKAVIKKQNFLRKHSEQHKENWMYLTGDSANIYTISDAMGFKFKPAGNDYIHAAAIIVVSPHGIITRYLYGTAFLPFDLKMAVIEASKDQPRPSINKVLEFCFSYDSEGKRYVLDILKISGTLILFFIIVFGLGLFLYSRRKKKQTIA